MGALEERASVLYEKRKEILLVLLFGAGVGVVLKSLYSLRWLLTRTVNTVWLAPGRFL